MIFAAVDPGECTRPLQCSMTASTLIAAAMLLALASPAFAADDADFSVWDCPHGVRVTRQVDGTFSANPPTRRKITQIADFYAPSPGDFVVQLDGRDCKYRRKARS